MNAEARPWSGFYWLCRRECHRVLKLWTQTTLAPVVSSLLFIVVFGPFFLWRLFRAAWRTGDEVTADHTAAHAGPWGTEAFARAYAAARGMRIEDRDAFRRRFEAIERERDAVQ